jgi:hypothetical protein
LAAPVSLFGPAGGVALALIYWRYLGILGAGAEQPGSLERRAYDALRASLVTGGTPTLLYSRWLTRFLDAVDHFFRDATMADRTLFPRAFGLCAPAPLWTAPAFDRCLLLGFIYPVVTIFIVWVVSGHVGPAEQVLHLTPNLSGQQRGFFALALGITACFMWQYARAMGWKSFIWLGLTIITVAVVVVIKGRFERLTDSSGIFPTLCAGALVTAGAGATAAAFNVGGAGAVKAALNVAGSIVIAFTFIFDLDHFFSDESVAIAGTVIAIAFASCASGSGVVAVAIPIGIVMATRIPNYNLALAIILTLPVTTAFLLVFANEVALRNRWQGFLLTIFLTAMILACFVSAANGSSTSDWQTNGPLLLFLGLLTIVNAPYDWASLGLTRALLRRGLELGGWWPYLLALVDALLAGVIIALLALTMVISTQAFDSFAVSAGGRPILPLKPLFDGLASHPEAPEYWWLYALLFSTMIPSLVNLVIGGTALTRTAPLLSSLLLKYLPIDRAVPAFDRAWLALLLTVQVAVGVVLGVAAQALLVIGLIRYALPTLSLSLLDLARVVADFDLPAKIGSLF